MNPTTVSQKGIGLVKRFEGLHKVKEDGIVRAYRCPAGKWTIGYGHCKGVKSGMLASVEECESLLQDDLNDAGAALKRHVHVPLSQEQYDALASFVFNIGGGKPFQNSTLLKKLNQGLYDEVPEQILRWNKARVDGSLTTLAGLTKRRTAEAALFSMGSLLPDEGGDLMVQKPEQSAQKPLKKSKTLAGAGVAGGAGMMAELASQLQPLIGYSESIKYIFLAASLAGVALVAYSRVKDNKEGIR
jgi:lysozyme